MQAAAAAALKNIMCASIYEKKGDDPDRNINNYRCARGGGAILRRTRQSDEKKGKEMERRCRRRGRGKRLGFLLDLGSASGSGAGLALLAVGRLALEHLRVGGNAVAVSWGNVGRFVVVGLDWGPGEVVSADLDVIVGKLSELVVIHTEELGFLRGTELETWDSVDGVADDAGDNKGVGGAGEDVGELDAELLPVSVEPSSCDLHVDTIHADNVISTEDSVKDEADHAGDAVLREHIHSIVNAEVVLDLGSVVANNTRADTEDDRSPWWDETGSRGSSNETRNQTGTETDHRPLLSKTEIEKSPGNGRHDGGQVGVPASHNSTKVGAESGSTVESQPSEPKQNGTESDERDVVRTEVEHHLFLTLSENERVGQGANSRCDFDWSTT